MLSVKKETLIVGIKKTVDNARQLIDLATNIATETNYPNKKGYSAMLIQTGLEELSKASFLFEKYLHSIPQGRTQISNEERAAWFRGNRSHIRKLNRVQQLYALSSQISTLPGISVIFPQGVEEMLNNRNLALYVDFSHDDSDFKAPSDWVESYSVTTYPSFAQELLSYCRFDYAVEKVELAIGINRKNKRKLIRVMEETLETKLRMLSQEMADLNARLENKINPIWEEIYLVTPYKDAGVQIVYTLTTEAGRERGFMMDNAAALAIIAKNGEITHSQIEIPEDPDLFIEQRTQETLEYYRKIIEEHDGGIPPTDPVTI